MSTAIVLGLSLVGACDATAPGPAPDAGAAGDTATAGSSNTSYVGTWGIDLAQCSIPQERQEAPKIVTEDGYDQHEAHCGFTSVTATGDAQWSIVAECSVEGDLQEIDFNLAVENDELLEWYGEDRSDPWRLVRCPG